MQALQLSVEGLRRPVRIFCCRLARRRLKTVNLRQARKIEANRTRLRYKGCAVAKAVALATGHERWLAGVLAGINPLDMAGLRFEWRMEEIKRSGRHPDR